MIETGATDRKDVTRKEQSVEELEQIGCKAGKNPSVNEEDREIHLPPEKMQVNEAITS